MGSEHDPRVGLCGCSNGQPVIVARGVEASPGTCAGTLDQVFGWQVSCRRLPVSHR